MHAVKRRCAICHTSYSHGESFCPLDGGAVVADAGPATDDLVGSTIDGRYLVTRLLGRGGMGKVYEADHVGLGKRVAIKFVSDADADRDQRARFRQEARAASRIVHENVIQIFDVGADGGRDYLVMEMVEGRDLDAVLRDGVLPPARAIAIAQQILRGLHACHAAGIVHRDIKPSNIRLTNDHDFVKIMDFGISKSMRANVAQTDTGTGRVIGTPEYMAPEQILDGEVDHRADIFAAGATLFAMLAGKPPFSGTSFTRRAESLDAPPPAIDELRGGLPPSLVDALARALAPALADRFSDAPAFADALADGAAVANARADAATKRASSRPLPSNRASATALAPTNAAPELDEPGATRATARGPGRDAHARASVRQLEDARQSPEDAPPERDSARPRASRPWLLASAFLAVAAVAVAVTALIVTRDREPSRPVVAGADAAITPTPDAAASVAIAADARVESVAPADAAPSTPVDAPAPAIVKRPMHTEPVRTALPAGTVIPTEAKGKPCICEFRTETGSIDRACTTKRKEPLCTCQRRDRSDQLCPFPITVVDGGVRKPDGTRAGQMNCVDRTRPECDPTNKDMPKSCLVRYRVAVEGAACSGYVPGMVESDPKLDGTYSCSLCDGALTNPRFYGKTGDTCVGWAPSGDKVTGALRCWD